MNCVFASGINPFDKFYNKQQQQFDEKVLKLLTDILMLNLTIEKTPLMTNFDVYKRNPESWIVEQIVNGTAEMSSSSVILSGEVQGHVGHSSTIGTVRPQLFYKARSLRDDYNIYLIPFSSKLWVYLIATTFILIIVLTFILRREAKLPHKISYDVVARLIDVQQDKDEISVEDFQDTPKEVLLQKEKWETVEILLTCLGAVCQQGSARDPSTHAARILILCLFVLAIVWFTAYSASLISLVSLFPSTEQERMVNLSIFSSQYKTLLYGVPGIHDLPTDFEEVEYASLRKGFDKVFQDSTIYIGDKDISLTFLHEKNYSANSRCALGRFSLGLEYHRVFALRKNSKFKEKINHSIAQLQQFGLLNRERMKIFITKPPCTVTEKLSTSNFVSFNENDVKPIKNLFLLGILSSILILLAENIIFLMIKYKNLSKK